VCQEHPPHPGFGRLATVFGGGVVPQTLEGIGGSVLYLVEKDAAWKGWTPLPGAEKEAENEVGLMYLDHLTHNVRRGRCGPGRGSRPGV
jgi:4-hydroxyphenylpyruvate dioxygenase